MGVGDFEDMLNTVHSNLLSGHPFCEVDKWFDNHYAIDSQSADGTKIVNYVNKNNPFHVCSSGMGSGTSLAYVFDPTGWGIQLDLNVGTPSDCNSVEHETSDIFDGGRRLQGGKFNPACTTDTSKCGTGPSPGPSPSPPSPSPPAPTPPKQCGPCWRLVGTYCNPAWVPPEQCMECVGGHRAAFGGGYCDLGTCQSVIQEACSGPPSSTMLV